MYTASTIWGDSQLKTPTSKYNSTPAMLKAQGTPDTMHPGLSRFEMFHAIGISQASFPPICSSTT